MKIPLAITKRDESYIDSIVDGLKQLYSLSVCPASVCSKWRRFLNKLEIFKEYNNLFLERVIDVYEHQVPIRVGIIKTLAREWVIEGAGGGGGRIAVRRQKDFFEIYPILLFTFKKELGHTLIRPETLADKFLELFGNLDIDFPAYRRFSRRYFVLSKNETDLRRNMPGGFLTALGQYKGQLIEIQGKQAVINGQKQLTPYQLGHMVRIGLKLQAGLKRR